jgi:hypothetical protein
MVDGSAAVLPVLTIAEIMEQETKKLPRVCRGLQISPGIMKPMNYGAADMLS